MGADYFESYVTAKNAAEAFSEAREEALYMHGHGGYSGTIAEKNSYEKADMSKGIERMVNDLKNKREACKVGLQRKLLKEHNARFKNNKSWFEQEDHKNKVMLITTIEQNIPDAVKTLRNTIDRKIKILTAKRNVDADGRLALIVEFLAESKFQDKWGPAGCIEIEKPTKRKQGKYVFFGYASS